MRFTNFVLNHLPQHRQYNLSNFDEFRLSLREKAKKSLEQLERLSCELNQEYNGERCYQMNVNNNNNNPPPFNPNFMPSAPSFNNNK